MIELLIAACLAQVECRDHSLLYSAHDVSLMTCMVAGQAEVARWTTRHPLWTVERWECRFAGDGEQVAAAPSGTGPAHRRGGAP